MQWIKRVVLGLPVVGMLACGDEASVKTAPTGDEVLSVVEPGKEDNFLSQTAQEYLLTGTTTLTLEAEWAGQSLEARTARARELVPFRQTVLGWFLNAYMVEKSEHDGNQAYGGFKSLTKNGSWEDLNLREVDELTFAFDFRQEIAGPVNLLSVLPTQVASDGTRTFDLVVGKISTLEMQKLDTNSEWYRNAPWSAFNPASLSDERKETITLTIAAEPRSSDAWFDYAALVEDGVLDIGVHFGWDYHDNYHLKHSRDAYDWLVTHGFKSPVASYDDLTRRSGPLTRAMDTPLGPVEMRVSLYWGKPSTETDPDTAEGGQALEEDMRASFKDRDVIIYSGHSGPFYAFALANWRKTDEGDLDDSEIPDLEMPERYQVVMAEGCDTYGVGQAFFLNPAKRDRKNVDVVTTTSFSNAGTASAVTDFLAAFVGRGTGAKLDSLPRLTELLTDLDTNSSWFTTMYGVHGIDDNPHAHPFARTDLLCDTCVADADCGGLGNKCVVLADRKRACTYECTTDEACGTGYLCQAAQSGGYIRTQVCVSTAGTCAAPTPPPEVIKIARVVPNPNTDLNGDGVVDTKADELVELVNAGSGRVDLSGWSIADNASVRFTFPAGFILEPGRTIQVFGGGAGPFAARRGLGLNNDGDTVRLSDGRGSERSVITWRSSRPGAVVLGD